MTPVPSFASAVSEGGGVTGAGTGTGTGWTTAAFPQPREAAGSSAGWIRPAGQAGPQLQCREDATSGPVGRLPGAEILPQCREAAARAAEDAVIKGTSGEFSELAGTVTFLVGKCRPELNKDRIKEIITKCAQSCGGDNFVVEDVKCLTKDPSPWTRSLKDKVSVPARLEAAIHNPKMYPGT